MGGRSNSVERRTAVPGRTCYTVNFAQKHTHTRSFLFLEGTEFQQMIYTTVSDVAFVLSHQRELNHCQYVMSVPHFSKQRGRKWRGAKCGEKTGGGAPASAFLF